MVVGQKRTSKHLSSSPPGSCNERNNVGASASNSATTPHPNQQYINQQYGVPPTHTRTCMDPEKHPSASVPPGVGTMAGGRRSHRAMSYDTTWSQRMPQYHWHVCGRAWKKLRVGGGRCGRRQGREEF